MFDPVTTIAAQRRHLAAELRALPIHTRNIALRDACIDHGGCLIEPQGKHGPVEVELTLLDLFHSGDTVEMALDNWIKAAERCAPQPADKQAA